MSPFLLAVLSFETHVGPFLAVATALRDHGHEVAFYAGPRASQDIAAQGLRIFPFRSLSEELADSYVAGIVADRRSPRRLKQHWYNFLVSQLREQIEDLQSIADSWQPDVVVSDMALLGPFVALGDLTGIPIAVLSHVGYSMSPGPQGPVAGRAFPPDRKGFAVFQARLARAIADFVTRDVPRGIDAFRRNMGLEPLGLRVVQYYNRVALCLVPTVAELDYQRTDLPPTVCYTGACFWPPVAAHQPDPPRMPRQRIVVDEGSLHTVEPTLLRASVEAFRDVDCDLVLVSGRSRTPGSIGATLGQNMRLLPWRPVDTELAGASLLITTGNTESVLNALFHGIPVLVAPSILDQSELAWRAKWIGAGEFIPERTLSPDTIKVTAVRILGDPTYRESARHAGAILKRRGGSREAADLLVQLASTHTPQPT